MSNRKIPTTVNFPEDLLAKVDAAAKADGRSRSSLIVHYLLKMFGIKEHHGGQSADKT